MAVDCLVDIFAESRRKTRGPWVIARYNLGMENEEEADAGRDGRACHERPVPHYPFETDYERN